MENYFTFIIIISLLLLRCLCYELHNFEFTLVDKNMKTATFISPTKNFFGDIYIVTGNDEDLPEKKSQRYIMYMDLNTMSLITKSIYNSDRGFYGGEAFFFSAKNDYLFIPAFSGNPSSSSFEVHNLAKKGGTIGTLYNDDSIYGLRRAFIQANSYYYFIHYDNNNHLYAKKMEINGYDDESDSPNFKIVEENKEIYGKYNEMISCDLTSNRYYILCAYFTERINIAVFNSMLRRETYKYFSGPEKFTGKDFIKILYFKGNSDFILMYSQSDSITRLRYFNYKDDTFTDKLGAIIGSSDDYLDIYNTQLNGNYGNNDIDISEGDKVIKIFGDNLGNELIITIIQFYENDSQMTIKIYNMKNENGFNYFKQSRITIAKNSIIFCASAEKNNSRLTGYSLINYPNANDMTLTSDSISVESICSKINTIYHLDVKLKIYSIPGDIIIYNYLSSKRIYNIEELEMNNKIILKEYRINEGKEYIIYYQGIARGNDLGYNIIKKYPSNKEIKDYNEIAIEGRKGQLKLSISKCLEGFYPLEDDLNLCTNLEKSGYYLDKENKIYRHCKAPCIECEAPINITHQNCRACQNGYYLTEDTNVCYDKVIENYYIDGNMLRRCHKNCLYCSTGSKDDTYMKCTQCYLNWYMTEDTNSCYDKVIENYYLDGNILRRCHKNCLYCSTKAKNDTYMNCIKCYPNWYLTEDTNSCYNGPIDNYYIDGDTLKRCYQKCFLCSNKRTNITHMNCLKCYDNWYLTEDTKSCYNVVIDNYYLYNETYLKKCHENCLHCTTNENNDNYMNCTQCLENFYMTEDTNSCYDKVIDNYYLDKKVLRRCHKNCLHCTKKEINDTYMNCLECQKNLYMTEDTQSCFEEGIDNYYKDNNTLKRCHPNCLQCHSAPINSSYMNCKKCQNNFFMTEDTESCYDNIIDNYYKDNDTLKRCHKNCLHCTTGSKNDTYMNCTKCPKNFFITEDTDSCYDYIPNNYYLDNLTYTLKRCFYRCSDCIGAKNNFTHNCLGCSNDTYFYKKNTYDCILKEEIVERNINFSKKHSVYFYIFIGIFIATILIFIFNCIFYKTKKGKKLINQQEKENKTLLEIIEDDNVYEELVTFNN